MHSQRRRLQLAPTTIRTLTPIELTAPRAGYRATSEAIDGYPCPGEYSWACTP